MPQERKSERQRKREKQVARIKRKLVTAAAIAAGTITITSCTALTHSEQKQPETTAIATEAPQMVEMQPAKTVRVNDPDNDIYPYNTMSRDWGAGDLDGFTYYEIPEEYSNYGGCLPEIVQIYTYCTCKNYGVDYATILAMIEIESGYQWGIKAESGATGYMQIIPEYHTERMHSISVENVDNPYSNIRTGVVKKSRGRKYRVIAGHRRRLAAMALTEEGKEQFRYVPCVLQKDAIQRGVNDEIIDKLELILANGFRDKTDFEKMTEIMELKEIAKELKKEYSLSGRVREWQLELIQLLGIPGAKAAQISRYEAIYNNLEKELMQEFKNERLIFSVAAEVAGMEREWQLRAYDKLLENGELSLAEVKQMKKQIEAEKQCPGQMELPDMQEKDPEDEAEPETAGEEQKEETEQSEPAPQEEWIDPEPETVEALCYSCDKYEVCHEKKSTVTKCNAYVNRKEARLTEEEKYNREQAAIDRETKKKLQEKAQEEKMQNLPGDTKKKKYVRISRTQYEEMEGGKKPYIILKSAEHFNAGDIITAQVFEGGRSTGEVMDLYITCIDDENTSSAINSGYVIAGILKKEVAADLGLLEDVEE